MLVMKPSTLQSAHRGLLAVGGVSMALLFLYSGQGPLPESPLRASRDVTAGDLPSDVHSQRWQDCRRLLRMTDTHFTWESDDDGGGEQARCRRTQSSVEDRHQSLQKLKELRGRAPRLVFAGDSRVKNLHETLTERLGMKPLNSSSVTASHPSEELQRSAPSSESVLKSECVEAHANFAKRKKHLRSAKLKGDALQSEYWWHRYIDDDFADGVLNWVLCDCATGNCPDLVVIDSGAWYAGAKARFPGENTVARTTRFLADLNAIRAKLAQLAVKARVVWKLDESVMAEPPFGRRTGVSRVLMALTAAIYQTAARTPGLNVWSSGYVEAMHFYHQVCRPNWKQMKWSAFDPVQSECKDEMHVGSTVRWRTVQTILNLLLLDVNRPVSGLCCGV